VCRRACRAPLPIVALLVLSACASAPPEPLPPSLDISASAHPYFETIRRQIRQHWTYPCVNSAATGACEYKDASVRLQLAIRPDGTLAYVDVTNPSGLPAYDEAAVTAVRRAAPFPPVPPEVMAQWRKRDGDLPLNMNFNYVVERQRENVR
jgi:TonB family protein